MTKESSFQFQGALHPGKAWVDPGHSQVSICSQTGEKEATLDLMLMIISPQNWPEWKQTPHGPSNIKWKSRNLGLNCWSL